MQQEYQQQLAVLHANVEEVQQAQQALAASTSLRDKPADQDSAARLQGLEQEIDQLRDVTHRLERYVEQMLRQMLGTLNSGGLAYALVPFLQGFLVCCSRCAAVHHCAGQSTWCHL